MSDLPEPIQLSLPYPAAFLRPHPRPMAHTDRPHLEGAELVLGEQRLPLRSGAVHYWRLRREHWEPALKQVQALGLPIVETYVPWAVHEVAPGEFDFGQQDPRKDLPKFLELADSLGLKVIVRPGPHINAELTRFGIPERVINDPKVMARSPRGNPVMLTFPPKMFPVPSGVSETYHEEVGTWFDAVVPLLTPKLWPAGPIVMVQVDNEAGHFFRNGPFCQGYEADAIPLWADYLRRRHGSLEALNTAHGANYDDFADATPPKRFSGKTPAELCLQCDWQAFQSELVRQSINRFKKRLRKAGLKNTLLSHNVSLGDAGAPISVPALNREVDLVGFDYYHAAREHRTIKRRTLYLEGTLDQSYAPELGVGAPPWFTPLDHEDSFYTAMAATAFGLRGFNLYMAVDRDRWYGAPIDALGRSRTNADPWRRFIAALDEVGFETLHRPAEVALVIPKEYQRLCRATHLLGALSPANLEAVGGSPIDLCRGDRLGFEDAIQLEWWRHLARVADALTAAGVPYVYVDSEAAGRRLEGYKLIYSPTFEMAAPERWNKLRRAASRGAHVIYGPRVPSLDARFLPITLQPAKAEPVDLSSPEKANALVHHWIERFDLQRPYATLPPIETALHRRGDKDAVLFVMNPQQQAERCEVILPRPTRAKDLLRDEVITGENVLSLSVPARTVRIFSLAPLTEGNAK